MQNDTEPARRMSSKKMRCSKKKMRSSTKAIRTGRATQSVPEESQNNSSLAPIGTEETHNDSLQLADDGKIRYFQCCLANCGHTYERNQIADTLQKKLWEDVSGAKNVVTVICPGCKEGVIQCCWCNFNFDPNDPEVKYRCGTERRSPVGLMTQTHVRQHHPANPNVIQPEVVDFGAFGDNFDDDNNANDLPTEPRSKRDSDDSSTSSGESHDSRLEAAQNYAGLFTDNNNIDPNDCTYFDLNTEPPQSNASDVLHRTGRSGLRYEDFAIFDLRKESEKTYKNSNRVPLDQNQLYFWLSYLFSHGGFRGLTGRSNARNRDAASEMVSEEEGHCMFRLFITVMRMTESQQEDLVEYQCALRKLWSVADINNNVKTRFPEDMNEVRTALTRGAHSILKNFPAPRVFEICNHACVDLKEALLHLFGHGVWPKWAKECGSRNKDELNGTKAMNDLIDEVEKAMEADGVDEETRANTKIGYLLFWSDSFLRCFVKQKDNSVWLLTVTVCPPGDIKGLNKYTIILAMGKSSEDHSKVVEHYMEAAAELMKGFDCYSGSSQTMERVAMGMLVWKADRPEMQALTLTLKEGIYGKISGWAVNPSEEFLPACPKCYTATVRRMLDGNSSHHDDRCNSCCNWSLKTNPTRVDSEGRVEKLQNMDRGPKEFPQSYPVPTEVDGVMVPAMPKGRTIEDRGRFPPVQLSTKWIKQAVEAGYFGVRLGKWSKKSAKEYFRTCNV